uniref:Uncharacterized protein LOC116948432 isoform X2 n=1 Tax=Petromyzon marinus TaxID=7757 RepID=A0AAJ7X4I8_PETMA|nr:uncharacterized protein LOC116948432 isoform X2 [Petromyzon marinus]
MAAARDGCFQARPAHRRHVRACLPVGPASSAPEEYITLNLLLTAVLSRLCLHGVSMAKGFEFPDALAEWLGPDFTHVLQIGAPLQVHKAKISSDLLELLFVASDETFGDSGAELVENPAVAAPAAATTAQPRPRSQEVMVPDIGKRLEQGGSRDAVECKLDWLMEKTQNTGHGSEREVKRDPGKSRIISCVVPAAPPAPVAPAALWLSSGACEATTFTEMTDALGALVRTCRRQHQRRPMLYLGGLRLKCARLAKLERLGYELQGEASSYENNRAPVHAERRDGTVAWSLTEMSRKDYSFIARRAGNSFRVLPWTRLKIPSRAQPRHRWWTFCRQCHPGPMSRRVYSLADQHGGPEGHTVFTGRMVGPTQRTLMTWTSMTSSRRSAAEECERACP